MIPERLLVQEAEIVSLSQTGSEDDMGVPEIVEARTSVKTYVQPRTAEEIALRAAGRSTHRAWLLGTVTVDSFDELVLATGQIFEIDGPPMEWRNPRTGATFYELNLVAFEGDEEESA